MKTRPFNKRTEAHHEQAERIYPLESKIPDRQSGSFINCPIIRKFSNWAGLTLIELLMVIAVIALLMAITIPELKQAREEANAIIYQSNLHQWGAIFLMYPDDNDGREKQLTAEESIPLLTRML